MAKIFYILGFFLILFLVPQVVSAATLSVSPASGAFEVGNQVSVKIIATSNNVPFNAVSGVVSFPTSIFSIESVYKTNSVLNFWVTEPIISGNTVKFEGIALGGFGGVSGNVITVNLRATNPGQGEVSFKSGQILANDGSGTNITGNLIGGNLFVKEATSKPKPTEPKPTVQEVEPEAIQPAPNLNAPEIVLGTNYGAKSILGTSDYPKSQALVTFVSEGGTKIFILGLADADGKFNVVVPNSLKQGVYKVTAIMIEEDKANSAISNEIIVKVGSIISDVTWHIWALIGLLMLAILYLILRTFHHFNKIGVVSKSKLHHAEAVLHKSFEIIREDINEYDSSKDRSSKEHEAISGIKKDISDAEKVINKTIKDVDS